MKEAGLIKEVGLSVYSNSEFETAINDEDIDVMQLPFNLLIIIQKGGLFKNGKRKKSIQVRSVFLQELFLKN